MKNKLLMILTCGVLLFGLTDCGSSDDNTNNKSSIGTINAAIDNVLADKEELSTANIQKNMKGWIIVEADASPTTRNNVSTEPSDYTTNYVWTTPMWITVYNENTKEYKDVRIMKGSDGNLMAGSESGATGTN